MSQQNEYDWTDSYIKELPNGKFQTYDERNEEFMVANTRDDAKKIIRNYSISLGGGYCETCGE